MRKDPGAKREELQAFMVEPEELQAFVVERTFHGRTKKVTTSGSALVQAIVPKASVSMGGVRRQGRAPKGALERSLADRLRRSESSGCTGGAGRSHPGRWWAAMRGCAC